MYILLAKTGYSVKYGEPMNSVPLFLVSKANMQVWNPRKLLIRKEFNLSMCR